MGEIAIFLNTESEFDCMEAANGAISDQLITDEVVMQWLMELDAEHQSSQA